MSKNLRSPMIVAELSANHNGSLKSALKAIEIASKIGCDAIKFQTYKPGCLTLKSSKKYFKIKGGLWDNYTLWDLYKKAHTPFSWHKDLFKCARDSGIMAFSSPFSKKGVDLLESLNCPMYKIASFEVMDLELLECVAQTKKPLIISTGIATDFELESALKIASKFTSEITLLKCTSSYPASFKDANLLSMKTLESKWKKYGVKVGLSDHTPGIIAPITAAILGASLIEKHFIVSKKNGGVDSAFSLDKNEFKQMIEGVKNALESLGESNPKIDTKKLQKQRIFSRSIFITKPIKKGEKFTEKNIKIIRPNDGIHPHKFREILGKVATKNLRANEPLRDGDFK